MNGLCNLSRWQSLKIFTFFFFEKESACEEQDDLKIEVFIPLPQTCKLALKAHSTILILGLPVLRPDKVTFPSFHSLL